MKSDINILLDIAEENVLRCSLVDCAMLHPLSLLGIISHLRLTSAASSSADSQGAVLL